MTKPYARAEYEDDGLRLVLTRETADAPLRIDLSFDEKSNDPHGDLTYLHIRGELDDVIERLTRIAAVPRAASQFSVLEHAVIDAEIAPDDHLRAPLEGEINLDEWPTLLALMRRIRSSTALAVEDDGFPTRFAVAITPAELERGDGPLSLSWERDPADENVRLLVLEERVR